mgnify:CR=1 FL=1
MLGQLEAELDILQVEKRIRGRVKRQMEKSQREYYLNEQLKAIQRELGNEGEDGEGDEVAELTQKIATLKLSKEARTKATAELKKLKTMAPMSAEATVVHIGSDPLFANYPLRGFRTDIALTGMVAPTLDALKVLTKKYLSSNERRLHVVRRKTVSNYGY